MKLSLPIFLSFLFFQVEEVELIDRKGYLTLCLTLVKEGRVLLRKPEGIREWFHDIKVRHM
jgi:hypothetical protein